MHPCCARQVWRGKDTSAGAIAASGLLHLSSLVPEQSRKQTYREAGAALFAALADGYLGLQADPPLESLLANGTFHVPKKDGLDVGLIWGESRRCRACSPAPPSLPPALHVAAAWTRCPASRHPSSISLPPLKPSLCHPSVAGDYYFMDCLSLLLPSANATCAGL